MLKAEVTLLKIKIFLELKGKNAKIGTKFVSQFYAIFKVYFVLNLRITDNQY